MDSYFPNNNYPENFKASIDRYDLNKNYFNNKENGVFIELGAIDGIYISNTKYFEDNFNWTGILIEPNTFEYEKLKKNRPNCYLFNNLVSNLKEKVNFVYFENSHMAAVSGVLNSLPNTHINKFFENKNYLTKELIPESLTNIIKSTTFKYIDLLSLDVEGHELEVLESYDFNIPIKVILIEMLPDNEFKNEKCRKILYDNKYKLDCVHGRDEIYILNNNK